MLPWAQIPQSNIGKSFNLFFLPSLRILILIFDMNWSSWPESAWFYTITCCHMVEWWNEWAAGGTGVPNEMADKCIFAYVGADREKGSTWDLWALDWIQRRAECIRFCLNRAVSPAGQLPVSSDIEYEFGTRNVYNFLQLVYYKVKGLQ